MLPTVRLALAPQLTCAAHSQAGTGPPGFSAFVLWWIVVLCVQLSSWAASVGLPVNDCNALLPCEELSPWAVLAEAMNLYC